MSCTYIDTPEPLTRNGKLATDLYDSGDQSGLRGNNEGADRLKDKFYEFIRLESACDANTMSPVTRKRPMSGSTPGSAEKQLHK
ncbi:hypothetical protein FSP39_017796 [Pinctada imbricata]|uniref:Uncharacterized protein n=1 Tax=Pinctada imbricata TaxID=66713 RepID=A0AA88XRX4_PINIB|nr:hypothetical protein FSP39_017796 [Pinctada imbricata]